MLLLYSVPTPGEMQWKCPGSQTCHCCAVLWERERSSIAVSLLHRAKTRHPALCFSTGVRTHIWKDIFIPDSLWNTWIALDRRVLISVLAKCIRFISNKRRSLAVHGELCADVICCCSSLYEIVTHFSPTTGSEEVETRILSPLVWLSRDNPDFDSHGWGDNI